MSFLDLLRTLERITRPPRRDDDPAAALLSAECRAPGPFDCLSCGFSVCRWPDGPTVERPDCSCGLGDGVKLREHWSSCAVWDDCDFTAKLADVDRQVADMEAEMDRLKAEEACAHGRLIVYNGPDEYGFIQARCDDCDAITTGGRWPDGRYATIAGNPMEAEIPDGSPLPGLAGRLTETIANLRCCNLCGGHCNKACEQPNAFEPALTDDELVAVRGLIQERYDRGGRFMFTIGAQPDSPAASAAGVSPSEACDIPPPSPSEGRSLATWLEPAVMTVLAEHVCVYEDRRYYCHALGEKEHAKFYDQQEWCEHVAPLITAHIAQALPDFPAEDSAPTK